MQNIYKTQTTYYLLFRMQCVRYETLGMLSKNKNETLISKTPSKKTEYDIYSSRMRCGNNKSKLNKK